jgi:amiloride-sensitive sodium channel
MPGKLHTEEMWLREVLNAKRWRYYPDIDCFYEAGNDLLAEDFIKSHEANSNCNCLPACTSISYDFESSQTDYDVEKMLKAYGRDPSKIENITVARFKIFFSEAH